MIWKFIWQRSPVYWLFYTGLIYFIVAIVNLFVYKFTTIETIQFVWVIVMSLPLWVPPLARWLNAKTIWSIK